MLLAIAIFKSWFEGTISPDHSNTRARCPGALLGFFLLWPRCFASDFNASLVKADGALQEVEVALQEIQLHNAAITQMLNQKAPLTRREAHSLTLEATAERVAEHRLFEAMNRADQDLRGGRNSTNQTNQIDASCHECSWFDRLLLDISRQRIFVLAGLIASLVILTCGCFWGYRRKSEAGDLEIGTDDLDEVWFRKPAPPGSPASPSPKGLPKGPRRS
ncbi:unnamed protein product [Durusdinium trenchii]|uniref:Uncharacterized protein n=1 Tax=Durusdinium trenchii TaxID=1381693 RepID=A0ABP0RGB4_9DINO